MINKIDNRKICLCPTRQKSKNTNVQFQNKFLKREFMIIKRQGLAMPS